jgi:hypothetical protein
MRIPRSSLSTVASTWLVLTLAGLAAAPAEAQDESVSGKYVAAMQEHSIPSARCARRLWSASRSS